MARTYRLLGLDSQVSRLEDPVSTATVTKIPQDSNPDLFGTLKQGQGAFQYTTNHLVQKTDGSFPVTLVLDFAVTSAAPKRFGAHSPQHGSWTMALPPARWALQDSCM